MKKLKLNLDDLKVESFVTIKQESKRGTINGQALTVPVGVCADLSINTYCPTSECVGCNPETQEETCVYTECNQNTCNTCYNTCDGYGPTCIYPECLK